LERPLEIQLRAPPLGRLPAALAAGQNKVLVQKWISKPLIATVWPDAGIMF
jgi:hypothetical protein